MNGLQNLTVPCDMQMSDVHLDLFYKKGNQLTRMIRPGMNWKMMERNLKRHADRKDFETQNRISRFVRETMVTDMEVTITAALLTSFHFLCL